MTVLGQRSPQVLDAAEALLERNNSSSIREGMGSNLAAVTGRPLRVVDEASDRIPSEVRSLRLGLDSGEGVEVA